MIICEDQDVLFDILKDINDLFEEILYKYKRMNRDVEQTVRK
jgi:hypothetical protein